MNKKQKSVLFFGALLAAVGLTSSLVVPAPTAFAALSKQQCKNKYDGLQVSVPVKNASDKERKAWNAFKDSSCYINNSGSCGYESTGSGSQSYYNAVCVLGNKTPPTPPNSTTSGGSSGGFLSESAKGDDCGGVKTAIIKCSQDNEGGNVENNAIWGLLLIVLNIMTAGVGVLAVGGIVYGAILYTTAEDKAEQVKKATDIITNVVIGLVAFALMWAGLNFLIPGGIFG